MSKKRKILIGFLAVIIIGGGTVYSLLPKNKAEDKVAKEINIKQAEVARSQNKIHEDYAGFSFEYPSELEVLEIEPDDESVYSSLELVSIEGGKMSVRITDTEYNNLDDWQKQFEDKHVVISIKDAFLTDIEGSQVVYGAPKELKTVAIEEGVRYEINSMADGGYWENIHNQILNSFEFDESVFIINKPSGSDPEGEEQIEMVEEIWEE